MKVFFPVVLAKSQASELSMPMGSRPIVVWQENPVSRVTDPIHQAQASISQQTVASMVLDDDRLSRDPLCLAQQHGWIFRVMQDIHEHYYVEGRIWIWNCDSVELAYLHVGFAAEQDVDTFEMHVRAQSGNLRAQQSVTTTDVEHARISGQ